MDKLRENLTPDQFTEYDRERLNEIHEMLTELMDVLRPLKAMAQAMGPAKRAVIGPNGRDAIRKIQAMG